MNSLTRCRWALNTLWALRITTLNGACRFTMIILLFEFLTLEGAQAGLSWETILQKREAYRKLSLNFDPVRVAGSHRCGSNV